MRQSFFKEVYLVGAGSHTSSVINLLEDNLFIIKGIYDKAIKPNEAIFGHKIIGLLPNDLKKKKIFLSIGDNVKRGDLFDRYKKNLLDGNVVHSNAIVEERVKLGISNQIFAFAYINAGAVIGNNNIINTGAIIEHDVRIGDHNHISIGSTLAGRVKIGNFCFLGASCTIINNINICSNVTIGANSVVIRDIKEPGVYVGIPAKKIIRGR
jgi:sugar O-acyltransferase (sialic acid O-acetyltransferase NeuD family)